uniref:Uncharacterized protein n=1 Tax=Scophthalmus maximus TaxID=52904 RepID=A0A8D3C1U6_SCOMX
KMFNNSILFVCLCLGLYSAGSALSCRWMDHKFRQYSENSLDLLRTMVSGRLCVMFKAEDRLGFTVQVLDEVVVLFEEDHSSASWEERGVENFLNVVTQLADGLRSCVRVTKKSKKLQMYFKRLSRHILERMNHSAESWELIRMEIQSHLLRTVPLVSSLLTPN